MGQGARHPQARSQAHAQRQGEHPERRGQQHPVDDHHQGLGHRLEEARQGPAQVGLDPGRGETEGQGEDHHGQDPVVRRRLDQIGRRQTGQEGAQAVGPRRLAHRRQRIRRNPGQQGPPRLRINGPQGQQPQARQNRINGRPDQQQAEHRQRPHRDPPRRRRVGDRDDARHQQAEHQGDDRHPQRVQPHLPQALDHAQRAGQPGGVSLLRQGADDDAGGQGRDDEKAQRGEEGGDARSVHDARLASLSPSRAPNLL